MKIAGILPHMGLCGGVRRYIEIGNEMIKRGHHFTIYHSDGSQPAWMEFLGATRPIEFVIEESNDIALCGHHSILSFLEKAKKKIFYSCSGYKVLPLKSRTTQVDWK